MLDDTFLSGIGDIANTLSGALNAMWTLLKAPTKPRRNLGHPSLQVRRSSLHCGFPLHLRSGVQQSPSPGDRVSPCKELRQRAGTHFRKVGLRISKILVILSYNYHKLIEQWRPSAAI